MLFQQCWQFPREGQTQFLCDGRQNRDRNMLFLHPAPYVRELPNLGQALWPMAGAIAQRVGAQLMGAHGVPSTTAVIT